MKTFEFEKFMRESNAIEGEDVLNPNDVYVLQRIIKTGIKDLHDILWCHSAITLHLNEKWGGSWRQVNVHVGQYYPPDWRKVPDLMNAFMADWDNMDSWEAHNRFEAIHPFQDFNGRMGRIIWLVKAFGEGYDFSIPFLQKYYYQTLRRHHG